MELSFEQLSEAGFDIASDAESAETLMLRDEHEQQQNELAKLLASEIKSLATERNPSIFLNL